MGPPIQISPGAPVSTSRPPSSMTRMSAQTTGAPTLGRASRCRPSGMMVAGDAVSVEP